MGGGGVGRVTGLTNTYHFFAIMPVFEMYLETFRCDKLLLMMFDFAIAKTVCQVCLPKF